MFSRAIVRKPGLNFVEGVTTAKLGPPILPKTLDQHEKYWRALEECGLKVSILEPDPRHPDSTFVEDVAILTPRGGILTRPGAESRRGEVSAIRPVLEAYFPAAGAIQAPGTLDGGDVCQVEDRFFIGISKRTNPAGAEQLSGWLQDLGYGATSVDIRSTKGILHLKSGLAHLGEGRLTLDERLAGRAEFSGFQVVPVSSSERYAANCVRVNDRLLIASGFPRFEAALRSLDFQVIPLDVSEFRKMDGGLSCLSLRF